MADTANPNETQSIPADAGTSGAAARKARVPRKAAALKNDSAPQATTTSDPKTIERNGSTWNTIIDGWVRDPMIRAYFFQMLLVVVLGGIIALGMLSGVFAAMVAAVLPTVIAKTIAIGCAGVGLVGGSWLRRRAKGKARAD